MSINKVVDDTPKLALLAIVAGGVAAVLSSYAVIGFLLLSAGVVYLATIIPHVTAPEKITEEHVVKLSSVGAIFVGLLAALVYADIITVQFALVTVFTLLGWSVIISAALDYTYGQ